MPHKRRAVASPIDALVRREEAKVDDKRIAAGQKLLDAAQEFWDACHEEGQYGAVQWLEGTNGELLIYTRGEYRHRLMENIDSLPSAKVHFFREAAPLSAVHVDAIVGRLRANAEAHEYIANADPEQRQWMEDLYDAASEIERLRAAILWALGEAADHNGRWFEPDDDEPRLPDGQPVARYWWRGNLRRMTTPNARLEPPANTPD